MNHYVIMNYYHSEIIHIYTYNQVLKVLKDSNLNYLVNETPYSAFITIRKKLLRHIEERETGDVTFAADIITNADIALTQENLALKIRC